MSVSFPSYFVEEIRQELIEEDRYTDDELYTFIRNSIKNTNFLLRTNHSIIDSTDSVYDYTVSGTPNNDFWEVVKWRTVYCVLDNYYKYLISSGVGVSIALGSERFDTKTVLISVREKIKSAESTYKSLATAYNMLYKRARIVSG